MKDELYDLHLECVDCRTMFTVTAGEQAWFAGKDLAAPKRCKSCRRLRREEMEAGRRSC